MHNIELTEKHKSKLLEMCKILFPEYNNTLVGPISFHHNNLYPEMLFGFLNDNDSDSYNHCDLFIHWFEFCMRYITPELDDLYFKKVMYPLDPYHHSNKGKQLEYPEDWQQLWRKRPYEQWNHNCNGRYYKKHPIDYLYEEFNILKSLL